MTFNIPIILFVYNRPDCLRRTLDCLLQNKVPLIYAFSDAPRTAGDESSVFEVRSILRSVDWCEVILEKRETNLGLGQSIISGVSEILGKHESAIVFEDDLICIPGTYDYLCSALEHYRNDSRVMSVTGWTHPIITPPNVTNNPYFDGRAESWLWGTWARAWEGMKTDANTLMKKCEKKGIDVYAYGADLPLMAKTEFERNIWAVRFLYLHILNRGLCMRPPWSMVEHIGFEDNSTNVRGASWLKNPPLKQCPPLPALWPDPVEHNECSKLWQNCFGPQPEDRRKGKMTLKEIITLITPPVFLQTAKKIKNALGTSHDWEYVPEGWAYGAGHPEIKGWNVSEILEVYKKKWPKFVEMLKGTGPLGIAHESDLATNENIVSHNEMMALGYVLSLASSSKNQLSILDWGGGIGHYYLMSQTLLPNVNIEYHCKDLPLLSEHGTKLFPKQHFYKDDSCFKFSYDLVIASASLHYTEDWRKLLQSLAGATLRYVYIANLPVVKKAASFVFVQRAHKFGYNTEYLGWCLNQSEFLEAAKLAGLTLTREFVYGHEPLIHGAPEQNAYRGYLFNAKPRGSK